MGQITFGDLLGGQFDNTRRMRFDRLARAIIPAIPFSWRAFVGGCLKSSRDGSGCAGLSHPRAESLERRVFLSGSGIQTIASFMQPTGFAPNSVVVDSSGNIFGTTSSGGAQDNGTIFEIVHGGRSVTTLASFNLVADGDMPGGIVLDSSGNLFGTTSEGGTYGLGIIFELPHGGTAITSVVSSDPSNGGLPSGLTVDSAGDLIGVEAGEVVELAHGSSNLTNVASFNLTGTVQPGGIVLDSQGDIFTSMTELGIGGGGIYEIVHGTSTATMIASLDMFETVGNLAIDNAGDLFGTMTGNAFAPGNSVFEIPHGSSTINTLAPFTGTPLTLDSKGDLFETMSSSATTVLEIAHGSSSATTVATFSVDDGMPAFAIADSNGDLYGTTAANTGVAAGGTVFEIAEGSGTVNTLASFNASAGLSPTSIVASPNGDFFGATSSGGANNDGVIFHIAAGSGVITTIFSFNTSFTDPGTLILDSAGDLFGTEDSAGPDDAGSIFEIASGSSILTTLATFNTAEGVGPDSMVLDAAGNLFGTTIQGGANDDGSVFELAHGSSVITTIVSFNGANGARPESIALDSAGDIFGGTQSGTADNNGDVFEIPHGTSTITVVADFSPFVNGASPSDVVIDSSGDIFGTTSITDIVNNSVSLVTIFEIPNGSGTINTISSLSTNSLTIDSSGNLFGASSAGGNSDGALFEVPHGTTSVVTLATFNGTNGSEADSIILDSSGQLFGFTADGGSSDTGTVFSFAPNISQQLAIIAPQVTALSGLPVGGAGGLQVQVQGPGGLVATQDNSTVTLTLTGGVFSNGQTTATAVAVNGIATFSNLSVVAAGSYSLTASDGALTPSAPAALTVISPGATSIITAPDVTSPGAATSTITIDYVDAASAINVSSLQSSNFTVTSPDGTDLAVRFDGSTVGNGGNSVVATYTIDAPGGSFSAADIGSYVVTVDANSVLDASGAAAAVTSQAFAVNFAEDGAFGSPGANGAASGSISLNSITAQDVLEEQVQPTPSTAGGTFLLLVGQMTDPASGLTQGVLEQFQADGSTPNNAFGPSGNGIVTTPAGVADAFFGAVIQDNGQIVAVGSSNGAFLVARYNADGSIDGAFGTGGFATATFSAGTAVAYGVALEADGSIVVAGSAGGVFAFARFTGAGQLDASFNATGGTPGEVTLPGEGTGEVADVAVEPGGRIVGAGSNGSYVVAVRLNPDGSFDDSFGTGGTSMVTQLASSGTSSTAAIALQSGGGILLAGDAGSGYGVLRLTPSGQVDSTFGTSSGESIANFNGTLNLADSIVVSPAGDQFVVVGITNPGGVAQVGVAAFNPDGTPDANFGQAGQTLLPAPAMPAAPSLVPAVARPASFHPQIFDFAFAAYQDDGKVLVGASNHMVTTIRRLSAVASDSVQVGGGAFGHVGHKNIRLAPFTLDGATVTITVTGGSVSASTQGSELVLGNVTGSPSITVKTSGGDVRMGDITVTGKLLALDAPTAILDGMVSVSGAIGKLNVQAITGVVVCAGGIASIVATDVSGSIAAGGTLGTAKLGAVTGTIAAGQIHSLTATSMTGATILAGANLGSDGVLGGSGTAADSYKPGSIASLTIIGLAQGSFVGAGVNPVDGLFGDGDDITAGSNNAIKAVTIKGSLDAGMRFEASGLSKTVHVNGKLLATGSLSQFVKL